MAACADQNSPNGTASLAVSSTDYGNPDGHFPVPTAGKAVNTTHPNHVVGDGTPASCTSAAVVQDVAAGGIKVQLREEAGHDPDDRDRECGED